MRDGGPENLEELGGIVYTIYMAEGPDKLRTECELD